jgi:hypothetical protein
MQKSYETVARSGLMGIGPAGDFAPRKRAFLPQFVEGDIVPVLAAQFGERDPQRDGDRLGRKGAAPFKPVQVIQNANHRRLHHVLQEIVVRSRAPEQTRADALEHDEAQFAERRFTIGATGGQTPLPFETGRIHANPG